MIPVKQNKFQFVFQGKCDRYSLQERNSAKQIL